MTAPGRPDPRAAAWEAASEALHRLGDALHLLAVMQEPETGPGRSAAREPEVLLTTQEAADLLKCSLRHVERLVAGKPCRRRAGRRVLIERNGLLALLRRG